MSWIVYILKSQVKDIHYTGMTQNLDERLAQHNAGKSKFTSAFVPWEVIYSEVVETSAEARKREKYFKSAAGRRFIKNLDLVTLTYERPFHG